MPKTKPFSELRQKMPDTPERRFKSAERRRGMEIGLALGKLCDEDSRSLNVTKLEHHEGTYLATLRDSVELLGGHLEINAVFPDRTVQLVPAEDDETSPAEG